MPLMLGLNNLRTKRYSVRTQKNLAETGSLMFGRFAAESGENNRFLSTFCLGSSVLKKSKLISRHTEGIEKTQPILKGGACVSPSQ